METDETLSYISALTQLRELGLRGNSITDCGLLHLIALKDLHSLYLDGPCERITDHGIKALLAALPQCSISDNSKRVVHQVRPDRTENC
jgi:hypothetical protein